MNAVIRAVNNKIATLDLSKAHDKVVRKKILADCAKVMEPEITDMLKACIQALTVTKKGDTRGTEAEVRLGLTQGAILSPSFFVVYVDDLGRQNEAETANDLQEVQTYNLGKAEISLTEDDVIIHTSS